MFDTILLQALFLTIMVGAVALEAYRYGYNRGTIDVIKSLREEAENMDSEE